VQTIARRRRRLTTPTVGNPAVETIGLEKSYGGKQVLRGIDLQVAAGTVFGYIGPNGAGKSTTVKILVGLLNRFEGEARVAGIDARKEPTALKRRLGYVPENIALYEGLTAHEYLQLVGRLHDLDDRLIERRIEALLDALELSSRAHAPLSGFSKGMRQKVMLAAALLHDPQVLFLDEPLSGLDVGSTILIKELIRSLARDGKTIFYCSHVMDVVERVCDRIAIIDDGQIVADGSFEELSAGAPDRSLEELFGTLTRQPDPRKRVDRLLAVLREGGHD
jgi:ABC-2 type transport system ATP-binding protein